jgi:hypothetical protein
LSDRLFSVAPRYRHVGALGLAVALLLFGPIRLDLHFGQIEPMLLLLLSLALAGFLSGRDSAAGFWLGLAVVIKPLLGPLILFFLWKRAYRTVAVTGTVLAAAGLVSLPLLGSDGVSDYLAVLEYWSSPDHLVTPINQSLYGFLLRLFMVNQFTVPLTDALWLARLLHGLAVLGIFTILALAISRSRALPLRQQALEYGLACVAMLFATLFSESLHFGIVAFPLVAVASAVASVLVRSPHQRWKDVCTESSAAVVVRADQARRLLPGALLSLGALAVYAYLSLPGTLFLMMVDYAFLRRPLTMPALLLTGAFLYALVALGGLVLLSLNWYRSATVTARGGAF